MNDTCLTDELSEVVARADALGKGTSDFDLNPEFRLPKTLKLRKAAVLLPFLPTQDGAHLILTKRSAALRHHPGQIAFPGGKQDPADADLTATALREAQEEIGLAGDNVDVVGTLPSHETVTGFEVTPVLGRVRRAFVPQPEAGEVDEVFAVPYAFLADSRNFSVQSRIWQGKRRAFYTIPWGPYYIWGATARILRSLACEGAR